MKLGEVEEVQAAAQMEVQYRLMEQAEREETSFVAHPAASQEVVGVNYLQTRIVDHHGSLLTTDWTYINETSCASNTIEIYVQKTK